MCDMTGQQFGQQRGRLCWQLHHVLMLWHIMQVLAAAREQELQERAVYARAVLEHFDRKVNDPEHPQSPLMHFLDGLLKVLLITSWRSYHLTTLHDSSLG